MTIFGKWLFRLFKTEMQQQLISLREHFLDSQKGTHKPKNSPNLDARLLSHGSEYTIQNGMVNKNYDIDKNSDFIINLLIDRISTAQKMKFFIKDFFSICNQIRRKVRVWSHLLKKSLMGSFIFSAVTGFLAKH